MGANNVMTGYNFDQEQAPRSIGEQPGKIDRILLIEDDHTLVDTIRYSLQKRGYHVTAVHDGDSGLKSARSLRPDLILLDLMLPEIDGRDVCRHLRSWTSAPILILTALDREEDVVSGLEAGADDYLTKPFGMAELIARVRAILRRVRSETEDPEVLVSGELMMLLKEHRATFHGRELRLPPKEFKLLVTLARNAGKVFTRDQLLDEVWGKEVVVDPRNVDVHVRWLRAQLEGEPDGSWMIQTVHGVGYRFAGELGPSVQPPTLERGDH
jgi:DNA-binding response OmpR family regulator